MQKPTCRWKINITDSNKKDKQKEKNRQNLIRLFKNMYFCIVKLLDSLQNVYKTANKLALLFAVENIFFCDKLFTPQITATA